MCARVKAEFPETPDAGWTHAPGPPLCDQGTLTPSARTDALRRLNLYRWLCGLKPVTADVSREADEQACAVLEENLQGLSHTPSSSAFCYSDAGAHAASESNLAAGVFTPAQAVTLFMIDGDAPSLGHRRWCLAPGEGGTTAFGHVGWSTCMASFSMLGKNLEPGFVAFPAPGLQPRLLMPRLWSYAPTNGTLAAEATMRVTHSGAPVAQGGTVDSGNYGSGAALILNVGDVTAGDYDVTITEPGHPDVAYRVSMIDCP